MGRLFNEPVMLAAAIRAILVALMAFGFELTLTQIGTVMLAVETFLAWGTRALVTPVKLAEERMAAGGSPTVPRKE